MSNMLDVAERVGELYRSSNHTPINIEESLFVLDLGCEQADRDRISELLACNQTSDMTNADRIELENVIKLGTMLDSLQSRARMTFKKAGVSLQ